VSHVSQDPAFNRLKNRLIAETGLAFYEERDEPLAKLIGERLSVLGVRGCSSYSKFLADGEAGRSEMRRFAMLFFPTSCSASAV
jgi:hypothetical protein